MKHPIEGPADIEGLRFTDGLVPVIAQDHVTGSVLMLAWADKEALRTSLETGRMTYWSRSRQTSWTKGETSGHTQRVVSLSADCDHDAVLAMVEQEGPACHEGTMTCWTDADAVSGWLGRLDRLIARRKDRPEGRYTDTLLADAALAAAKIEEEASEVGAVLRGEANDDTFEHEAADLLYHVLVGIRAGGSDLEAVLHELRARQT